MFSASLREAKSLDAAGAPGLVRRKRLQRVLPRRAYLDQRLAGAEELGALWPRLRDDSAECRIGGVPRRHPHDLRGRAVPLDELHEVYVFRDHHRASSACSIEDGRVVRSEEPERERMHRFDAGRLVEPGC